MLMASQIEKTESGLRWVRWAAATARSDGRPLWPPTRTARRRDRPNGQPPGDFHCPPDRIAVASGGRPECRRIPWTGPTDRTAPPLIVQ